MSFRYFVCFNNYFIFTSFTTNTRLFVRMHIFPYVNLFVYVQDFSIILIFIYQEGIVEYTMTATYMYLYEEFVVFIIFMRNAYFITTYDCRFQYSTVNCT